MSEHIIWLVGVIEVILTIGAFIALSVKASKPFTDTSEKVRKHDERLDKVEADVKEIKDKNQEERLKKLETEVKELKEMSKMICKGQLVLMEHEITGNSIDKLKDAKGEMQTFLIEKVQ